VADFVLTLAKESGGWSERYILLELPFSRAMQYRHVILRRRGIWTLAPNAAPEKQISRLRSAASAIMARFQKPKDGQA